MGESLGVLAPAYFASRLSILSWLNDLLSTNMTKIEETASGVAACQVFDALYPGEVKLEKVNFNARRDYEYVVNYKVLQGTFSRVGIQKAIDVELLIKGKTQDNLAFMQWVKGFFDANAGPEALEYDAVERRRQIGRPVAKGSARPGAHAVRAPAPRKQAAPPPRAAKENTRAGARVPMGNRLAAEKEPMVKKADLDAALADVADLNAAVEDGDREREFYFGKLRDIEIIIQRIEESEEVMDAVFARVCGEIKEILYKTDETAEGEAVEGEVYDDGYAEEYAEGERVEGEGELLPAEGGEEGFHDSVDHSLEGDNGPEYGEQVEGELLEGDVPVVAA